MTQSIKDLEFVAFDTETTGASAIADSLVEIAAVRFSLEKGPLAHFQTLINPKRPIPPFVTGIHGITDSMVKNSPTVDQVLPHFFQFLVGSIPVAHNARFDVDFIAIPAMRAGIPILEAEVLDSCKFARRVLKGHASYSLEKLTKALGFESSTYHRAQADSISCMELFRHSVKQSVGYEASWADLAVAHGPRIEFHNSVGSVTKVDPKLEPLLEAIRLRKRIEIDYAGGYGPREITPITLYAKGSGQYLEATCHLDEMRKTFRLDRITRVEPL